MQEKNEKGSAEGLGMAFGCFWVFPLFILLLIVLYSCGAMMVSGSEY